VFTSIGVRAADFGVGGSNLEQTYVVIGETEKQGPGVVISLDLLETLHFDLELTGSVGTKS
jgi:hypothetical protein